MNFIHERLNKDNFRNLVFWVGMTCWVSFSLPEHPMLALSSVFGMPFLIRKLSPLTVVEIRPELILEFPDPSSLTANSEKKAEKEELPVARECLANSEGKVVSDGAPSLIFALLSPLVIGFPLAYIFDDFMNSIDVAIAGHIGVATFFLIPVSIFILYNRPISLLFDWRAWYLQGWRQINGSSSSKRDDSYYSPAYSYLPYNIHHRR